MSTTSKPLIISLKPSYAELVFKGIKTAELRKRIGKHIANRDVFIYVSSPIMKLRGGFRIGEIWEGSPEQVWDSVSDLAGVSRQVFDHYYQENKIVYALEILDVWEYANPLPLQTLRERFPNFVAPQSYRYAKPNECRSFRNLKRLSSKKPLIKII